MHPRQSHSKPRRPRLSACLLALVSIVAVHYIMLYLLFDDLSQPSEVVQPVAVNDESSQVMDYLKVSTDPKKHRVVQPSSNVAEEETEALEDQQQPEEVIEETPLDHINREMHIVFSTGCSRASTEVSALILQSTAAKVGHRGPITRIASGCSKAKELEVLSQKSIYPDYRIHFTPTYFPNPIPGINDRYPPYNKPFGLRHWLQNRNITETIIALIDADFLFLRPLIVNTNRTIRYDGTRKKAEVLDTVVHGIGVAQDWYNYMRGGLWSHHKETYKTVCKGRPCADVPESEAAEYYSPTGPPYVMLTSDMRRFMDDYCNFTVEVRKVYKTWMSEMYGFAVAAANNGIKFTIASDVGVTHPKYGQKNKREHWEFTKNLKQNPCSNQNTVAESNLPVALHLCQQYGGVEIDQDPWWYYKRWQPEMIKCDVPLLELPPEALWEKASKKGGLAAAETWVFCTSATAANTALLEYRAKQCPDGYNTNTTSRMIAPNKKKKVP